MRVALQLAVSEYREATKAVDTAVEIREKAIRSVYEEISNLLIEAGLDSRVVISGSDKFSTISLRIDLPENDPTGRFLISSGGPHPESSDSEATQNRTDHDTAGEPQE